MAQVDLKLDVANQMIKQHGENIRAANEKRFDVIRALYEFNSLAEELASSSCPICIQKVSDIDDLQKQLDNLQKIIKNLKQNLGNNV